MKFINLTGLKFGKLMVVEYCGNSKWRCLCDCGKETIIRSDHLRYKDTRSCGCLKNKIKHGHCRKGTISKAYMIWGSMVQRCNNPKYKYFKDYGGRGITVCKRWNPKRGGSFKNFFADIGEIPEGKSLDRIDNNKLINGYSPENCKLSTMKEQSRNKRNNIMIPYKGEDICLKDYCKIKNLNYPTIQRRINKYGWSIGKALTTPVRKWRKK